MIQEIKYNGHTANPSDYECNDGDLAVSVDAVLEDGALRPVMPPTEVFETVGNYVVKYIHETSNFKHYIILYSNRTLVWQGEDGADTLHSFSTTEIYQVTSIGNTLVVLAADGMHFFLWKGETDGYLYLGTQIPECPLSFGLQGEYLRYDLEGDPQFSISQSDINAGNFEGIEDAVHGIVNKFIADEGTDKGRMIFPFFVRYAYRLYDGSLVKHSAPILMLASDIRHHSLYLYSERVVSGNTNYRYHLYGLAHDLDYKVISNDALNELKKWGDIVKSVEVFISAPIYTYDPNGKIAYSDDVFGDAYTVCKLSVENMWGYDISPYLERYQVRSMHEVNALHSAFFDNENWPEGVLSSLNYGGFKIPVKDEDVIANDIKSCSTFYLLKSFELNDLNSEARTKIDIKKEYLQSLVAREVMTDDFDSHDSLVPSRAFIYNNRLNVCDIQKLLFNGFHASSMVGYTNGYVEAFSIASVENGVDMYRRNPTPDKSNDITLNVKVYVYVNSDGETIVVDGQSGLVGYKSDFLYIYYPNVNAYKAVIVFGNTSYEVLLKKHDFLNGAFYMGNIEDCNIITSSVVVSSDYVIRYSNKIYTSEVNNPFYFPVLGINTIGTGKILGMSSAAKALSEGQFGQFPLYAFTSDGVWALEVSATGTYSAKQPITRDICINPDSITQIDSAVLFATNRGIMLISGSQTQCITDVINSPDIFTLSDLPKHSDLLSVYSRNGGTLYNVELMPLLEFIAGCKMVYDCI